MRKLFLSFIICALFTGSSSAQEQTNVVSKNSFIETNFGVAFLNGEGGIPFPGASVLWGQTYINKNNLIFEYEAGFAFPTLVTAKLGVGRKFNNTKFIVGIRPWPFNIYGQFSFGEKKIGYWITSIEYNPINSTERLSKAILNFGYRWNL